MVKLASVLCVVMALGAVLIAHGLEKVAVSRGAAAAPVQAEVVTQPAPPPSRDAYGEASIAKSPDGHFWVDAEVDGANVHFLVDTGATAVALRPDDARRLGLDPGSLTYDYTVMTANGPAHAAKVKLGSVAVGRAQVSDVDAFVIDNGLATSLLGMTYLGRLSKFEATPEALVLKS
jgi:aspartyl protease family protein